MGHRHGIKARICHKLSTLASQPHPVWVLRSVPVVSGEACSLLLETEYSVSFWNSHALTGLPVKTAKARPVCVYGLVWNHVNPLLKMHKAFVCRLKCLWFQSRCPKCYHLIRLLLSNLRKKHKNYYPITPDLDYVFNTRFYPKQLQVHLRWMYYWFISYYIAISSATVSMMTFLLMASVNFPNLTSDLRSVGYILLFGWTI